MCFVWIRLSKYKIDFRVTICLMQNFKQFRQKSICHMNTIYVYLDCLNMMMLCRISEKYFWNRQRKIRISNHDLCNISLHVMLIEAKWLRLVYFNFLSYNAIFGLSDFAKFPNTFCSNLRTLINYKISCTEILRMRFHWRRHKNTRKGNTVEKLINFSVICIV